MLGLFKTAPGPGNMEVRETPKPSPGPGQVLVKVEYTGVCGSDLHIYHSDIAIPVRPPVITGHEFSGTIVEVGEGVTGWNVGDRVTSETAVIRCDTCELCQAGLYNVCPERRTLGYWVNGAFASYVVVPARNLHRLPENVDFLIGAMTEPTACCVHAGATHQHTRRHGGRDRAGIHRPDLRAAGHGRGRRSGGAGHQQDKGAPRGGEGEVRCGGDNRRGRAGSHEGDRRHDPRQGRRRGAGVLWGPGGARMGLELVKRCGQFTQVGLFGKPIEINFERICYKELKVTGSIGSIWSAWHKALYFMEKGLIDLSFLATDILPLTEWQEAFRKFEAKEGLKVFLKPVD